MFAADLKAHRERLGLTQAQLGELLPDEQGVPTARGTVDKWERDERQPPGYARPLILAALARARPKA